MDLVYDSSLGFMVGHIMKPYHLVIAMHKLTYCVVIDMNDINTWYIINLKIDFLTFTWWWKTATVLIHAQITRTACS